MSLRHKYCLFFFNLPKNILKGDRYGSKIGHYFTNRFENAEIDDEFDFWLLEEILKKKDSEGEL